jgi:hypothetical protein
LTVVYIQNIYNTNRQERKLAKPDSGLYQRYRYHKMYRCVNILGNLFTSSLLLTYLPLYFLGEGRVCKVKIDDSSWFQVFMQAKRATARKHNARELAVARLIVWSYRN